MTNEFPFLENVRNALNIPQGAERTKNMFPALFAQKDIPVFSKDWWLDCVCGQDNWDVVLVEKGGQIIASMPYPTFRRALFNVITMPPLTQILGPFIKYPQNQKLTNKLSYEKSVLNSLIEQLPSFD